MLLQAALNGAHQRDGQTAVPISPAELAADAAECVQAGAGAIHLHPRDANGREQLTADVVDDAVRRVKELCRVPVGVSTGAWIEPDPQRRAKHVRTWRWPDSASVNLSEDGAMFVMRACLDCGIGIEAGVSSVEDAERLARSGYGNLVSRILIEPVNTPADSSVAVVDEIHAVLDRRRLGAPRLQHGEGDAAWILLEDAVARGIDTRIGLEDTRCDRSGAAISSNGSLVRAAHRLGAGAVTAGRR
ncbi:Uncharacterized conserved protein, DUF849 family [Frankineae bacterium MT45]|nr:Uncharacterized conserved protein, DUF849 family [Frankineae bacterium MT45]